jgi:hypothetical protein
VGPGPSLSSKMKETFRQNRNCLLYLSTSWYSIVDDRGMNYQDICTVCESQTCVNSVYTVHPYSILDTKLWPSDLDLVFSTATNQVLCS